MTSSRAARCRGTRGSTAVTSGRTASPTGTLIPNTHRQSAYSVSSPPSSQPVAPPPAAAAVHTPTARRRPAPRFRTRGEQGQRGRREQRRGRSLQRPEGDQHPGRPRQCAQQRRGGEPGQPDGEGAPAAQQVRHPAADDEEAAEAQRVGGDDPREPLRREPQLVAERRQRGDDHGDVEHHHELRDAQQGDRPPAVPTESGHAGNRKHEIAALSTGKVLFDGNTGAGRGASAADRRREPRPGLRQHRRRPRRPGRLRPPRRRRPVRRVGAALRAARTVGR